MNNYLELNEKISEHVKNLFNQYQGPELCYHNLNHTKAVVTRTLVIAADYSLPEAEMFILTAAAWFHDTGHLFGNPKMHEDRSVTIMRSCLEPLRVEEVILNKIEKCICATKFPHHPKSLLDEIICDADTYNLGTKDFLRTDKLLKKELELRNTPVDDWKEKILELLLSHKYFTQYCRTLLNKGKEKNIVLIRRLKIK